MEDILLHKGLSGAVDCVILWIQAELLCQGGEGEARHGENGRSTQRMCEESDMRSNRPSGGIRQRVGRLFEEPEHRD